jgi:hypothetical protein
MKKEKQGTAAMSRSSEPPRTRTRTRPASVFGAYSANHPADNPVFGRRFWEQSLAEAAKEGLELPSNDTDHRSVFVSEPTQALALDRRPEKRAANTRFARLLVIARSYRL